MSAFGTSRGGPGLLGGLASVVRVPRRRLQLGPVALLGVPVAWLAIFFLVPVTVVGMYSVGIFSLFPGEEGFSLDGWRAFLDGSVYLPLFGKSMRMALTASVTCVLVAYPIAYVLAMLAGTRKYLLLLIIIVPFWTSFLLRILAWKVILGEHGVINSFAYWTNLRADGDPIPQLIYSQTTVVLVLTYLWVPFVVLPIFVSLVSVDTRLIDAAADLGASRWQAFMRITLPLSLPGVGAGFAFVLIPTVGEFVTPALVGGPSGFMYGNAIANQFGAGFDWQTGSVLAVFLFTVITVLTLLFARFLQLRNVAGLERA